MLRRQHTHTPRGPLHHTPLRPLRRLIRLPLLALMWCADRDQIVDGIGWFAVSTHRSGTFDSDALMAGAVLVIAWLAPALCSSF